MREKDGRKPSRTWLLVYEFRGHENRIVLGHYPETSLAAARVEAGRLREQMQAGVDPATARPKRRRGSPTAERIARPKPGDKHSVEFLVSEFTTRFLRPHRKRPEYAEAILARKVLPEWKGRDARSIKPPEVIELLDKIVADGSRVMANRTAALLGQLFKFGIHRTIVEDSPVKLFYRPGGEETPRQRTLTEAELGAYLGDPRACTRYERLEHAINVLLLTGQRRGELALARWSDIDFRARTWTIPDQNAKAGRGHVVPLSDWAVEELRALQREAEASQWVLPAAGGKGPLDPKLLTRGLAKCLGRFKDRGIQPFTLHDLRRTCRTGLARLKVEPHIAERVLNHVQPSIVAAYDHHAYLDEKRDALEQWAAHLEELRSRAKAPKIALDSRPST